jgi:hypothetical protein
MNMRSWIGAWRERGQVLIIVAVALVGLLALAGLAIDGGNLFMKRRGAQNAADAAALAGTRLIGKAMMTCDAIDYGGLDAVIARAVNEYAEGNGISDTNGVPGDEVNDNVVAYYVDIGETRLATVGGGTVPMGTSGVEVEVVDQHRTYFLVVVGIRNIPSSAQAMAMAGVVRQLERGAGLLPIAVPQLVVDQVPDGEDWTMFDTSPDKTKEGKFCYTPQAGIEVCIEGPDSPVNALRGWLNLNHIYNTLYLDADDDLNRTFDKNVSNDGCKDPPALPGLRGYASGDCPYAYPIYAGHSCYTDPDPEYCPPDGENCRDGDFIHGDPGSRSASLMEVYQGYAGETVYAPVFDKVYLREYMVDHFAEAEPPVGFENSGGGFSTAAGGSGDSWYYHVVGYVETAIPGGAFSNKVLRGAFGGATIASGLIDVSQLDGSCSLLVHGVTLWH